MAKVMGLRSKTCSPLEEGAVAFDDVAVENNRRQVPGWRRVVAASGGAAIRHDWKVCMHHLNPCLQSTIPRGNTYNIPTMKPMCLHTCYDRKVGSCRVL